MRSCTQLSRHISHVCSPHNSTSVEKRGPEKGTPSCAARSSEGGCCTWWNSRNTVDIRGGGGERGKSCVGKVSEHEGLKKKIFFLSVFQNFMSAIVRVRDLKLGRFIVYVGKCSLQASLCQIDEVKV